MSDNSTYASGVAGASSGSSSKGFSRVLGLGSLLAVAVGLVVSQGVMVLMLQGAGIAGLGFIIPLAIGYILALTYVYSFSELSLMIPRAGSLSSYTEVAIGHFPLFWRYFPAMSWWQCLPCRLSCCWSTSLSTRFIRVPSRSTP
ncbi:hypothetical protein [Aliamphritea spongicola]|nr:hypothetical protein [Aliamphritea spongicola]